MNHCVCFHPAASALLAALAAIAAATGRATAADVAVTPYRPTVSTPAALSAPGWLEAELGAQRLDAGAGARRDSLPYTLKLAFSDDWGIRIGGEAWVHDPSAAGQTSGGGDAAVVLKRRWAVNQRSAFGLEAGATFPTATGSLNSGSGATDYTLTGIYSADLASACHVDLNLGAARLGAVDPGTSRTLVAWAAALSRAVGPRLGVAAELSGSTEGGSAPTRQLLAAVTWSPSPQVTWDAGFAHGTTAASTRWSLFAGVTVLVARLF